jgi:hypothetical protein
MSKTHTIRSKGGELIHIDLNSHNATRGGKNSMTGGDIEIPGSGKRQMWQIAQNVNPVPDFSRSGNKVLKSKNLLLNNLSTNDMKDLKYLFSNLSTNAIEDAEKVEKVKKATLDRVNKSVIAIKALKPKDSNVRGSLANKQARLKKLKLIK